MWTLWSGVKIKKDQKCVLTGHLYPELTLWSVFLFSIICIRLCNNFNRTSYSLESTRLFVCLVANRTIRLLDFVALDILRRSGFKFVASTNHIVFFDEIFSRLPNSDRRAKETQSDQLFQATDGLITLFENSTIKVNYQKGRKRDRLAIYFVNNRLAQYFLSIIKVFLLNHFLHLVTKCW